MEADLIAALATSGATALVAAAATDTWQSTRDAFARVFQRAGRDDVVTGELDHVVARLEHADATNGQHATLDELTTLWAARLREVLQEYPEASVDIRAAIDLAQRAAAATPREGALGDLSVRSARDVYVSGRDQTITHHHSPVAPDHHAG
ncbi:hypothetical protein AB0E08_47680 [Streptomyces sp. NPDC048281]|uniref:hypothetical protein n=1 Tax=Streptomyces sp. NPDC048281 TaxID=3154715 RepID=UPI00342473C6